MPDKRKKKRPSHSAYSTLCKCLFKCFFWSSGMPHLEGEMKREKKKSCGTKPHSSFSKRPHHAELGTTGSASMPGPLYRTSQSWNASRNYGRGRYTTRTPQEGRCPSLWQDSVKNNRLTIILIKTTYAGIFSFSLSHRLQISNTPEPHQTACHCSGCKLPPRGARNRPDRQRPFRPPNRSLGLLDLLPRTTRLRCSSSTFEMVVQLKQQAFNK